MSQIYLKRCAIKKQHLCDIFKPECNKNHIYKAGCTTSQGPHIEVSDWKWSSATKLISCPSLCSPDVVSGTFSDCLYVIHRWEINHFSSLLLQFFRLFLNSEYNEVYQAVKFNGLILLERVGVICSRIIKKKKKLLAELAKQGILHYSPDFIPKCRKRIVP